MANEQRLDISWETIIKVFVAGFIFYILFLARHIVIWFFFALIISLLLDPAINFLKRLRFPKLVAVILIYLSIFGLLGLMLYLIAPIFIFEINQFGQNIPDYFQKLDPILESLGIDIGKNFQEVTVSLISSLQDSSQSIFRAISVFFGGITSTIFILIFAFYISLEDRVLERTLSLLAPKKYEDRISEIFEKAQFKVSRWFGARILACLFVGIVSFIVLFSFNVKYAFTLSLVSGALNFIPFIGPLITGLLTLLFVGISNSWVLAIYILVAFYIIQAIENNFITPLLLKKFLDLPPILVLMSILIGGTMFGLLGVMFVVPVFGIVYEFLKEFLEKRKEPEMQY